jgi:hypothetical protein
MSFLMVGPLCHVRATSSVHTEEVAVIIVRILHGIDTAKGDTRPDTGRVMHILQLPGFML